MHCRMNLLQNTSHDLIIQSQGFSNDSEPWIAHGATDVVLVDLRDRGLSVVLSLLLLVVGEEVERELRYVLNVRAFDVALALCVDRWRRAQDNAREL